MKLLYLKSPIATLRTQLEPTAVPTANRAAQRLKLSPWQSWYRTKQWAMLRHDTFMRDGFQCKMCGAIHLDMRNIVCDHKRPHRGDPVLFWDAGNLQTLCSNPCHNSVKQKEERSGSVY